MLLKNIESDFREYGTSTTTEGCEVLRWFHPSERYTVDFASDFTSEGWEQFDTSSDAHYFGVWVNRDKLRTLAYVEGDWIMTIVATFEAYNQEIESLIKCYDEGRIALVIDDDGTATSYHQNRKQFFIERSIT